MGLDSYLYKKTYVRNWENNSPDSKIKPERISYIVEDVGYWRKFNALHNYIVENFADGRDDYQHIGLTEGGLRNILDTLQEAKDILDSDASDEEKSDKLSDVFPTAEGFFFGSNEYDDYYAENVAYTISLLTDLLDECEGCEDACSFYYQASW
jgi:hypothetical protein